MVFLKVDKNGNYELNKSLSTFLYISTAVGFGIMIFALILYAIIQIVTSSGFGELKSTTEEDDDDDDDEPKRERIDDNDDLEDV
jgi:hypothetical protein